MSDTFVVIADQDGDPVSIARKLGWFAQDRKLLGVSADPVVEADSDDAYEALEDQIETANEQLTEGYIGWHPEESGTLVYAPIHWFL